MPTWAELVDQLRWQDVVDVAILTFVLYRIYTWLRGTPGLQILLSMAALVVAAYGASALGLMLTAYVLQALGAVATLVVVVIFRGEIRRGLRQVDPIRLLRARRTVELGEHDRRFVAIADGALALAARRLGALIVVPRSDGVHEHLTGGTRLDAEPSRALFEAIFHTGSPLHDGAVIMDDRVRLAGAFLPLTASTDLPLELGTRHRAALGISEACDAIVVVVSEERGDVSLAVGGKIERVAPTIEALTTRLAALAAGVATVPRTRRGRIGDALALGAAFATVVVAWLVVLGGPGAVVIRTVEVELRDVPETLEVETLLPRTIRIHLRGPRTLLAELEPGAVSAWVSLEDARAGSRQAAVTTEVPAGIDVVDVVPVAVSVRLRAEVEE